MTLRSEGVSECCALPDSQEGIRKGKSMQPLHLPKNRPPRPMAREACLCPVLGAAIRLTTVSVLIEGSFERALRGKNRNNKHHNL